MPKSDKRGLVSKFELVERKILKKILGPQRTEYGIYKLKLSKNYTSNGTDLRLFAGKKSHVFWIYKMDSGRNRDTRKRSQQREQLSSPPRIKDSKSFQKILDPVQEKAK